MLLEFTVLGMKLMALIGIPLMLLLMPLHYFFGGGWKVTCDSRLTLVGLGNLPYGSPVFYVHALVVWYVVVVTETMLFRAMRKFLSVRFDWLNSLDPPQSTTVLVENIPEAHCSDGALKTFFEQMFPGRVESANIVKHTRALTKLYNEHNHKRDVLSMVQHKIRLLQQEDLHHTSSFLGSASEPVAKLLSKRDAPAATPENPELFPSKSDRSFRESVEFSADGCFTPRKEKLDDEKLKELTQELEELEEKMRQERQRIMSDANLPMCEGPNKTLKLDPRARAVNSSAGFVTFSGNREALLALNTGISPDTREFVMSIPPQPSDIIYQDLRVSPEKKVAFGIAGYVCIIILFCIFAPIVVSISAFVELETLEERFRTIRVFLTAMPWLRPFLRGVLATLVLMIFLSFLPTALMAIFRVFYTLKARAWLQQELQKYYFWFLVIFILLVTTFGTEIIVPALQIGITPLKLAPMLANSLPQASHFYLNYEMTQWVTHSLDMTRWIQLTKYLVYRRSYSDRRAVALAEPEDQDYYGIGARSARWTLDIVVGLVFCSVSPLINLLTFITLLITRVNYGYLCVFAETRKADLGGPFFVQQLWHVQFGLLLYAVLMCGIFIMRAKSLWPVLIALPSLLYCVFCMIRFKTTFAWEHLPFGEVCTQEAIERAKEKIHAYEQKQDRPVYQPPELCAHHGENPVASMVPMGSHLRPTRAQTGALA
jgi:hypothetical protein